MSGESEFVLIEKDEYKLRHFGLNTDEISLLKIIISLSKTSKCFASNAYFADYLQVNDRTIRRYLQKLKDKNLIKTFEERNDIMTKERIIYPQIDTLNNMIKTYKNKNR